jgi:hypothetical protein
MRAVTRVVTDPGVQMPATIARRLVSLNDAADALAVSTLARAVEPRTGLPGRRSIEVEASISPWTGKGLPDSSSGGLAALSSPKRAAIRPDVLPQLGWTLLSGRRELMGSGRGRP